MQDSQFYSGIVAELYEDLVPPNERGYYEVARRFIEESGQPALELFCGTGRPSLEFVAAGLDVEGLDASADMLARYRSNAEARGLTARLHCQEVQALSLPRRFRTIYAAEVSFQVVIEEAHVRAALQRFREHLEPGGSLWLPLHLPSVAPERIGRWGTIRKAVRDSDGAALRCLGFSTHDEERQVLDTLLRYEVEQAGELVDTEERRWRLRWYTQDQFRALLEEAGFALIEVLRGDGTPSGPEDPAFIFRARSPAS